MWKKILAIVLLFYFFALLQSSFFVHFNLFGAVPNLVFILFFLLVFFERSANNYQTIIIAVAAGIILDIFSYTHIGPSIILLTGIAFLLKGSRSLLKNTENSHPFSYFLPLFVLFFLVYDLLRGSYLYFLDSNKIVLIISTRIIFAVIYNAIIASAMFYVCKKFPLLSKDDRQFSLFNRD